MKRSPRGTANYRSMPRKAPPRRSHSAHKDAVVLYGAHSVKKLLETFPLMINSIMVRDTMQDEYKELARKAGYRGPVHVAREADLDKKSKGGLHQGVIAEFPGIPYHPIEGIAEDTKLILVLDQIQDPQNFGALIRSAVAFNCGAVIVPEHNQSSITGVVARASAGAVFDIPIVQVGNISNALEELKEKGFWVAGLVGTSDNSIYDYEFDTPTVLVMGSEGDGIREGVKKHCDVLLKVPMSKNLESLNVSVAAGIALSTAYSKLFKE